MSTMTERTDQIFRPAPHLLDIWSYQCRVCLLHVTTSAGWNDIQSVAQEHRKQSYHLEAVRKASAKRFAAAKRKWSRR